MHLKVQNQKCGQYNVIYCCTWLYYDFNYNHAFDEYD
jgi:hypothetical protein